MKNLLKVTTVLAAASLLLSGCNCFKKMAKDPSAIKVTATPEVLAYNNGKIAADIKAEIPADYFNKKATLKVTPAIAFEGGLVTGETLLLQGEKVLSNGLVVKKAESLSLNRHVEFAYQKGMERCELKLLVEVKCKNGEFTVINANNGALPTKEEAAVLAKGGDAAKAVKKAFGLTVAKGLNMLQKDLDYAEAMKAEANAYKNVTTKVVKADIVYKINSSVVAKKAVKTDDIAALKANVEANKANDRASQSVYVNGYASPDGPEKFNDKLSDKRSKSGLKAVEKLLKDSGLNIDAAAYGEDWEGFQEAVAASNIEDKDLILQVLKMYSSSAEREKEIKNMSSVFKALKSDVLPKLRRAQIVNSADITGKTDAEMVALINEGKVAELDLEELLHIAEAEPAVAEAALVEAAKTGDARALNNLAVVYAKKGNLDAALAQLDKAAKAGDKSAELNANYALVYLAKGETAKAETYAKGADKEVQALVAAAKGEYAAASKNLSGYNAAVAHVQAGNYAAASKSLAGDNSAKADYLRAVIAAKTGKVQEAKSQLNSAIAKDATLAEKAKNDVNLDAIK
ncbi:MAG: hypothetical protein ACI35T_07125 [Alistipes sp.]